MFAHGPILVRIPPGLGVASSTHSVLVGTMVVNILSSQDGRPAYAFHTNFNKAIHVQIRSGQFRQCALRYRPRRAAHWCGDETILEEESFLHQQRLDLWLHLERTQFDILVVSQDIDYGRYGKECAAAWIRVQPQSHRYWAD